MKKSCEDTRSDALKFNEVGMGKVIYKDQTVLYTILKKEAAPGLPHFVGYDNGAFYISEEVPEQFREFFLQHEIYEFTELVGKKGRCLEALKYELSLVPEELMQEYLQIRKKLFANLVAFQKDIPEIDEDFKHEIKLSNTYLQTLL